MYKVAICLPTGYLLVISKFQQIIPNKLVGYMTFQSMPSVRNSNT